MNILHPLTLECYGVIGTPAFNGYHVGDIVEIKKSTCDVQNAVICEHEGVYFPFGWRGRSFNELENKNEMKVVCSYKDLNKEKMKLCKWYLTIK